MKFPFTKKFSWTGQTAGGGGFWTSLQQYLTPFYKKFCFGSFIDFDKILSSNSGWVIIFFKIHTENYIVTKKLKFMNILFAKRKFVFQTLKNSQHKILFCVLKNAIVDLSKTLNDKTSRANFCLSWTWGGKRHDFPPPTRFFPNYLIGVSYGHDFFTNAKSKVQR